MKKSRKLRKLYRILEKVKTYKDQMAALSEEELSALTVKFKQRLAEKESLDHLLPEAFAAICEADYRILGKFPYDVQILGGIALHQGKFTEMNTGEGKTLTATMPLYLNALTGKSTILVTTNEYLALRDAEEMGQVYRFMGLSVKAGVKRDTADRLTNEEKQEVYAADIVYTTNTALGFDYLLHNLVDTPEERFIREFYYVIVDEADEVLLDSAQTPLIISGAPKVQSNAYEMADFFVTTLEPGVDYESEDKKVWLTELGVERAKSFFGLTNYYAEENFEINRHVTLSLRAHVLYEKAKEYIVSDQGEIVLLGKASGRMMKGVKIRGGQHQAIEMKEGLTVSEETRSMASITYQNLFRLFPKLAGMSGTIADVADEVLEVYGTDVIVIPPNKEIQRIDKPDIYFTNFEEQFDAAIQLALRCHRRLQPVLLVATTIGETEYLARMLVKERVAHSVLNANNAFWEAEMIAEAGQKGAVTVATCMAGRGTDIKLGEGVRELGGLAVIGVGRMENIRQERQAKGRSGRQGDPGFSQFFVSLEDEVVGAEENPKLQRYVEGAKKISERRLRNIINKAQRTFEENAAASRKRALDYDIVLSLQRKLMYEMRGHLLDGENVSKEKLLSIAKENIEAFVRGEKKLKKQQIVRFILDNISYTLDGSLDSILQGKRKKKQLVQYLYQIVEKGFQDKENKLSSDDLMQEYLRKCMLKAIDNAWVDQVDYLQQLQAAVRGRASAQRNVEFEYQKEGLRAFRQMEADIKRNMIRNILLGSVSVGSNGKLKILLP